MAAPTLTAGTWQRRRRRAIPSAPNRSALLASTPMLLANTRQQAHAADCDTKFLYPGADSNETFYIHDFVKVTYESTLDSPTLFVLCGGRQLDGDEFPVPSAGPSSGSVIVQVNFTSSEPCWFNLRPKEDRKRADCQGNSEPFRVNDVIRLPTTMGLATPIATSTEAGTSTPTPTVTAPTADRKNGGLSTGARVAIGTGVAVVVMAILGAIIACAWLQRQKRDREKARRRSLEHARGARRRSENPRPLLTTERSSGGRSYRQSMQQMPTAASDDDEDEDDVARGPSMEESPFAAPTIAKPSRSSLGSAPRIINPKHNRVMSNTVLRAPDEVRSIAPTICESTPTTHPASMYEATPIQYYKKPARNIHKLELDKELLDEHTDELTATPEEPSRGPATFTILHPHDPTELPGKESHRGYGEEFELSIPEYPQPFRPRGTDTQEQKFLLDDVELKELKEQARKK